tara:strand:- start:38 stop:262 length:225 start_codon:yes stop_codon:yes gene_type:complete
VPDGNVANQFLDGYWLTIVSLLKVGIPWDMIKSIDDKDMQHIFATVQSLNDYEREVQERDARQQSQQINMGNIG